MNKNFRAIIFDRKQRVAFFIILICMIMVTLWNIYGVSYNTNNEVDIVNLEEAVVETRNYKKYWRSVRKNKGWGNYKKSDNKNHNYSYNTNRSDYNNNYISEENITTVVKKFTDDNSYQVDTAYIAVPEQYTEKETSTTESVIVSYELHPFDPNSVSKEELNAMFLPEKWATNLINYRSKGGTFKNKIELKKLYTTTDDLYQAIEDYIKINDEALEELKEKAIEDQNKKWLEELKSEGGKLDMSTVNAETLRKLPHISTRVANGIVKYRTKLGGYHSMNQLSDVYHITAEGLDILQTYTVCNPVIDYININEASIDQLGKHPYIYYKKAKVIHKYIKNHGHFTKVEDVSKVGVWTDQEFRNLLPYLMIKTQE